MTTTVRRIKVLTGYAANARFQGELSEAPIGSVPRDFGPRTPYSYGPTFVVWDWRGVPVFIAETAHRRYEVFQVHGPIGPVDES